MRLGFVTPALGSYRDGSLWTSPPLGRLISAIAAQVDHLTYSMSIAATVSPLHQYRIDLPRAHTTLVGLPDMPSIARGLSCGARCRRALEQVEAQSAATIIQLPFSAPTGLAPARGPRVYHVCADVTEVVGASKFYRGPRGIAARATARAMDAFQRVAFAAPATRVVTNGGALYEKYGRPRGCAVVSSTLRAAEIGSVMRARPPGGPFTVLFVGFLRPEKGLDVLLEAFSKVLERDPTAELMIAGAQDAVEAGAARELRKQLERVGREGRITLLGHRAFGRDLFQLYADADVLVVPSRSEGTPRVLIEARAFGCPVIGSAVGGIPTSIADKEDGLLVPVGDSAALAAAIETIRNGPELRKRLVANGFARARSTTVESYAAVLVREARSAAAQWEGGDGCAA